MTLASGASVSKTIAHAGSISISRNKMWIGVSMGGKPNKSGTKAAPAIGTCTATT